MLKHLDLLGLIVDQEAVALELVLLDLELLGLELVLLLLLLEGLGLLHDPSPLPFDVGLLPFDLIQLLADIPVHLIELELVAHGSGVLRVDRVQN